MGFSKRDQMYWIVRRCPKEMIAFIDRSIGVYPTISLCITLVITQCTNHFNTEVPRKAKTHILGHHLMSMKKYNVATS
jgi:hypothetical protein